MHRRAVTPSSQAHLHRASAKEDTRNKPPGARLLTEVPAHPPACGKDAARASGPSARPGPRCPPSPPKGTHETSHDQ